MIRSHLIDSIVKINNKGLGLVKIQKTKEVLNLMNLLIEEGIIRYKIDSTSKFYINIDIVYNIIKHVEIVNPVSHVGWKDLKNNKYNIAVENLVILRTSNGIMTAEMAIKHKIGGQIVIVLVTKL
jgi:ribosomal protein S8